MTVQETIKQDTDIVIMKLQILKDSLCDSLTQKSFKEAIDIAIQSVQEIEQYRTLGTVEELKEAREKQIPQTPCIEGDGYADGHLVYDTWICPNCEAYYEIDYDDYDYCPKCGQAINKSVMKEGANNS